MKIDPFFSRHKLTLISVCCLLLIGGFWFATQYRQQLDSSELINEPTDQFSPNEQVAFVEESFQVISDNYWQALSEEQLSDLFVQALSQTFGAQAELEQKDRDGLAKRVEQILDSSSEIDQTQLLAQVVDRVLQNLQPVGRSRLYSKKEETKLANTVNNVDPQTDLLEVLGIDESASDQQAATAFEEKKQQIVETATDAAQQASDLAQVERAYQALGDAANRERYAQSQVEPTILGRPLSPQIFYLKISKFSPTTVEDLVNILEEMPDNNRGQALILDLRANPGGAIDGLPYFLGPFIGKNQYAYQFFAQGKTQDFKTKIDRVKQLHDFKQVVILIDGQSQSSAEVMAAALKKYRVGVLVGQTTKGWGTVERVFPLTHQIRENEKFSLFLVHSLTLDETGQPIEGQGVTPDVDATQHDWQAQLLEYFNNQSLVDAVDLQLNSGNN